MATTTKAFITRAIGMYMASSHMLMVKYMKVNGIAAKFKAMEHLLNKTEINMSDHSRIILSMALAFCMRMVRSRR